MREDRSHFHVSVRKENDVASSVYHSTGEGMLANQGALSFEKWTGKPFGEVKPVMREALMEALGRK